MVNINDIIDDSTFKKIQNYVYNEVGINLSNDKKALVSARLRRRMRELDIGNYSDYFYKLENNPNQDEIKIFINSISTNVTHFFREMEHFYKLEQILQRFKRSNKNRLRIWSAACSSGEEPYSIAMTVKNILKNDIENVKILATDISTKVLNHSSMANIHKNIWKL